MSDLVEQDTFINFKRRYLMRLELFQITQGSNESPNIKELKQQLEFMVNATWQELSEFQEQFFSICMTEYQQANDQHQIELAELKKTKDKTITKPQEELKPVNQEQPKNHYSTKALEAMQAAINEFWLDYDPKKPPTQKQVSNFIAEQLGEPIRNRFTDELARAIKPENI